MNKNGLELISSEEINAVKEFTLNTNDSKIWGERISNAEKLSQNLNTAMGAFGCLGVVLKAQKNVLKRKSKTLKNNF